MLLIFSLVVIGSYFPFLQLNALRLFLIIFSFYIFFVSVKKERKFKKNGVLKSFFYLIFIWAAWGALGCFFAFDISLAIKEWLDVIFGLTLCAAIALLVGGRIKAVRALSNGWVIAYLVAATVAVWELVTGQHLPNTLIDGVDAHVADMVMVISTFGNPNNYGAFLLLCFPFLLDFYTSRTNFFEKSIAIILISSLPIFLAMTASRGCFLGLILEITIFMYLSRGWLGFLYSVFILTLLLSLFFGVFIIFDFDSNSLHLLGRVENTFDSSVKDSSTSERLSLIENGIFIFINSYGIGVGPHEFANAVVKSGMPNKISIPNPHNFWIEVLSQYGIFVFLSLITWIFSIFRKLIYNFRENLQNSVEFQITKVAIVGLFGYLIASIENSAYIAQPTNWLFLGTVFAISLIDSEYFSDV